jgi:transcriptional regulator with XRE-family HTH domain
MTQSELAKQLGVSKSYVSMLMSGQRKPSKRVAEKLKQVNLTVNNECGNGLKIRWAELVTQSLLDFSQKYISATLY